MEKISRIVVFTANPSFSVRRGIHEILAAFPDVDLLIAEHAHQKPMKLLLRNQWRNLRRHGWRWIPYQLADIAARIGSRLRSEQPGPRLPGQQFTLDAMLAGGRVSHRRFSTVNGPECRNHVKSFRPDLGVSLAAPVLKPDTFQIPRLGTINLHKGKLPNYRGMPPAFWELWHDEASIGCTVHQVEAGLDTGDILVEREVVRPAFATVRGMQLVLDEIGVGIIRDAIAGIRDGTIKRTKQPREGKTNSRPTLLQERQLEKRFPQGLCAQPFARNIAKAAILLVYCNLIHPLLRAWRGLLGRQRVVILLYHRVNDDLRDSLTVGIEQFDRQMSYLQRYCNVVSIGGVLSRNVPFRSLKPIVAVTFDDGYLDNFCHASPILLKNNIPAAFFVSTDIVNSSRGFPHDHNKLGYALPAMTWENLRRLKTLGFDIGAHTRSHVRLSEVSNEVAYAELAGSQEDLCRELGLGPVCIAYPYGGRDDIDESKRNLIKSLGFTGCASAYGGRNQFNYDIFDLRRVGVDYKFSMLGFKSRLCGWG